MPAQGEEGCRGLGAPGGSVQVGTPIWLEKHRAMLLVEGLRGWGAGMGNDFLGPCGGGQRSLPGCPAAGLWPGPLLARRVPPAVPALAGGPGTMPLRSQLCLWQLPAAGQDGPCL